MLNAINVEGFDVASNLVLTKHPEQVNGPIIEECSEIEPALTGFFVCFPEERIEDVKEHIQQNLRGSQIRFCISTLDKDKVSGMKMLATIEKLGSYTKQFINYYGGVQEVLDTFSEIEESVTEEVPDDVRSVPSDYIDLDDYPGDISDTDSNVSKNVNAEPFVSEVNGISTVAETGESNGFYNPNYGNTSGYDRNYSSGYGGYSEQYNPEYMQMFYNGYTPEKMQTSDYGENSYINVNTESEKGELISEFGNTEDAQMYSGNCPVGQDGYYQPVVTDKSQATPIDAEMQELLLMVRGIADKIGLTSNESDESDCLSSDDILAAQNYVNSLKTSTLREAFIAVIGIASSAEEKKAVSLILHMFVQYIFDNNLER